jgi:hypothetical protein
MDDRPRWDPSGDGDPGLPQLDDVDVDRLLDGQPEGADADPGYGNLAELLAVAAGPPRPDELTGEASALAAFRATRDGARDAAAASRESATPPAGRATHPGHAVVAQTGPAARRRRPRLAGRTRRAPAMVVALAMVLGGLGATATAAVVTMSRRPAPTVASTTAPGARPGPTTAVLPGGVTTPTAPSTSAPPQPRAGVTGPDAPRHDRANLCNAWRSGTGNGATNKQHAQAFQELAQAAGGADRVEGYCRGVTPPAAPKDKGGSGNGKAKAGKPVLGSAENEGAAGEHKGDGANGKGLGQSPTAIESAAPGAATHVHPAHGPSKDHPKAATSAHGPMHSAG